jgi:hypothetical protein
MPTQEDQPEAPRRKLSRKRPPQRSQGVADNPANDEQIPAVLAPARARDAAVRSVPDSCVPRLFSRRNFRSFAGPEPALNTFLGAPRTGPPRESARIRRAQGSVGRRCGGGRDVNGLASGLDEQDRAGDERPDGEEQEGRDDGRVNEAAFTASAAAVTAAPYPSQRGSTALLWAVLRNRFVKFSNVRPPSAVRSRPRYRSKAVKTSQTNGMRNSTPIRASFPSA